LNISNQNITPPRSIQFTAAERHVVEEKENLTVSQWAEKYRVVTNGPKPGKWQNETTPYLTEPMDCWNIPWIRTIILCFAPQIGKTQIAFNCLCFSVDQDPGPGMYVMPDEKTTKRITKRRLIPMFRETPRITRLLSPRSDDTSVQGIHFLNGMDLMPVWATSAAELASESARYLFFDETDKYPEFTGREADPISLGKIRTNAYPHTKKILYLSTPASEPSTITKALTDEADEIRHYYAKCPFCGALQKMEFSQIVWPETERDPRRIKRRRLANYECVECGELWDDHMRDYAVRNGLWQSETEVYRPETVGFHLPSWYSPFISLSAVAADFLQGKDDLAKFMMFVTQHKAEEWKEIIDPKEESGILEHRTDIPPGIVPPEAIALTCGIDMQKHGFWFVVRAWAADRTSWLIQYGYLASWSDIEALVFDTRYQIQGTDKTKGIWRAALDTGGGIVDADEWSRTEEAYEWLRKNNRKVVYGIKGGSRFQIKKVQLSVIDKMPRSSKPIPGGLELRLLDTSQFKDVLHWRLGRQEADAENEKEPETQRFYLHSEAGMDYAKQILSEEKRRTHKGKTEWKQIRRDNHLLDCEVYASACVDPEWVPSFSMLMEHLKSPSRPRGRRIISKGIE